MDYKTTESEEADDEPTFNTSPNKHKNKTNKELLQNISMGLANILTVTLKKKGNNKKLKVREVSDSFYPSGTPLIVDLHNISLVLYDICLLCM